MSVYSPYSNFRRGGDYENFRAGGKVNAIVPITRTDYDALGVNADAETLYLIDEAS